MNGLLLLLLLSQATEPCLEQYKKVYPQDCPGTECPANEEAACVSLANTLSVGNDLVNRLVEKDLPPELVQPTVGTVGAADTPAQVDAAVSVKTVSLFGASLGISTDRPEDGALFTVAINPLAVSDATSPGFAQRTRLTDLKIVLPAAFVTQGTVPEFFGLRANFDFIAAHQAEEKIDALLTSMTDAHKQALRAGGDFNHDIRTALNTTLKNDPKQRAACLAALFAQSTNLQSIDDACMTTLSSRVRTMALANKKFRDDLKKFREEVEKSHGGLNVQLDVPTTRSSSTPFRAAVLGSYSQRLVGGELGWQGGFIASAGADYHLQAGESALGGALSASLTADGKVLELVAVHLSAGVKGHLGQQLREDVLGPSSRAGNYLHAEFGVRVPIGNTGAALAGSITWPVAGDGAGSPVFSTAIDYSYLQTSSTQK